MTFENFPGMLGLLKGVTGSHPFLAKIKFGYFSKFCLHEVAQTYSDNLRGVEGPHPFSVNVENVSSYLFWYQINLE